MLVHFVGFIFFFRIFLVSSHLKMCVCVCTDIHTIF
uniref:Uncharacterized protein n=1 Tax=Rhizophora mucronata TaxID=61149 RepID=A0A2P2K3E8_RHIMU